MQDDEVHGLIASIERETGVDIKLKCQKRINFYYRIVLFKILKEENKKITWDKMGRFVNVNHTSVMHAFSCYDNLIHYADFVAIEKEVRLLLKQQQAPMPLSNPMYQSNV